MNKEPHVTRIKPPLKMLFSILLIAVGANVAAGQTNTFPTSGNVGIGTTSPGQLVNLNSAAATTSAVQFDINGTNYGYYGIAGGTDALVKGSVLGDVAIRASSGNILLGKNSATAAYMYINSSGNVGIGTTSPSAKLHIISADDTVAPAMSIRQDTNPLYGFDFLLDTNVNGNLFVNRVNNGTSANVITLDRAGGNVGIGTTAPSDPLQIDAPAGWALRLRYTGDGQYLRLSANQVSSFTSAGVGRDLYLNPAGGNVGVGTTDPGGYKLNVNGTINSNSTITANNIVAKYQDVAEWVPSTDKLPVATVVVLDATKSNQVTSSTQPYDTRVAGVISERPGIALGESGEGKVLVATTGRVRVRVDASRSPIHIGDLLVTSDIPGMAMKSEAVNIGGVQIHRPGTLIGKALEPLEKGSGSILVLLSLQ